MIKNAKAFNEWIKHKLTEHKMDWCELWEKMKQKVAVHEYIKKNGARRYSLEWNWENIVVLCDILGENPEEAWKIRQKVNRTALYDWSNEQQKDTPDEPVLEGDEGMIPDGNTV